MLPLLLLRALCAMSKEQEKQLNKVVSTLLRQVRLHPGHPAFCQPLITTRMVPLVD